MEPPGVYEILSWALSWAPDEKEPLHQLPALRVPTAEELSRTDRRRHGSQGWGLGERRGRTSHPGCRASGKTSWRKRQQPGREAKPRKKGQRDAVRASLPSRTVFLRRGLGKWGFVSQLLPNLFITLQLLAQCSSWRLPVAPWTPARPQSPGRPGPIRGRLSMMGRPHFPFLPRLPHSHHARPFPWGRHY